MTKFIELLLFPPNILILIALVALLKNAISTKKTTNTTALSCIVLLYILSLPSFALLLQDFVRADHPYHLKANLDTNNKPANAIIILSGGTFLEQATETDTPVIRPAIGTIERLNHAARLQQQLNIPIIVTGGENHLSRRAKEILSEQQKPISDELSEAHSMATYLTEVWKISPDQIIIESQSKNTWENALCTSEILAEQQFEKIILVTHDWHLPRALWSFQNTPNDIISQIEIIPISAYSSLMQPYQEGLAKFIAQSPALLLSTAMVHEMAGMVWYKIRYSWIPHIQSIFNDVLNIFD